MENSITNIPQMLTVSEVATKTRLAKYFIRQLALKNKIQNVRAGKKILINFEKFVEYLNGNMEKGVENDSI